MALNDPASAALAAALSFDSEDLSIKEDYDGPWPGRYVIRIIDLKEVQVAVNGQVVTELHASFRNSDVAQQIPPTGMNAVLNDLVQALQQGTLTSQPGALDLSNPHTPLDLQIKDSPAYVIFVLGAPYNIRFNPLTKALTHKNVDDRNRYGRLRHLVVNGITFREEEDGLDDCRIIYFIANPPGPGPTPTQLDYKHGFNFNVRLRQPDGPNGEFRALDLQIDPDVRFPGGSPT